MGAVCIEGVCDARLRCKTQMQAGCAEESPHRLPVKEELAAIFCICAALFLVPVIVLSLPVVFRC
jgi:hypothetical protein